MGKICLSCGLAAPVVAPKPEAEKLAAPGEAGKLPPTCEECPTCPNCRRPMTAVAPKPEEAKPTSEC